MRFLHGTYVQRVLKTKSSTHTLSDIKKHKILIIDTNLTVSEQGNRLLNNKKIHQ